MQMPRWMKWAIALAIGLALVAIGWKLTDSRFFFWLLPAFFIVNCLVLIIVVLLQSGKAADLAGAFGGAGSQTAFGPRGAASALSSATTWCAIMFMVCAMALVLRTDKAIGQGGSSVLQQVSKPAPAKTAPATNLPATPAPATQTPTPVTPAPPAQSSAPQSKGPASQTPAQSPAQPPATQTKPAASQPPAQKPTPPPKP
jgi:preprotein translocase subunit SecG